MNILLIGSGGREHTIAWKLAQSPKLEKLFICPGNAGTNAFGENVNIDINNQVDLMLANGVLKGEPSSIVDLTDEEPTVIREGAGDISVFY